MRSVAVGGHSQGLDGSSQNVGVHTALLLSAGTRISRSSGRWAAASATGFLLLSFLDDDGLFERIGASYGRER